MRGLKVGRGIVGFKLLRLCLASFALTTQDACSGGGSHVLDAGAMDVDSRIELPVEALNDLDVLFMIDNSGGMVEAQDRLRRAFPAFEAALRSPAGVLPDLHMGVISSDLGAGTGFGEGTACGRPGGDEGKLLVRAGCGIEPEPLSAPFIVSRATSFGGDSGRQMNFTGTLSDVFSCVADLGDRGCGFEHQLESVRRALSEPSNSGFLRQDAALAIILLTDEDDCSAPDGSDLFQDRQFDGQQASLRCNLVGHECNGNPPPATTFATSLANCKAAPNGGARLLPVEDISVFVKGLKRLFPKRITVSAITGLPANSSAKYAFTKSAAASELFLEPICAGAFGAAHPSLRITQFVNSFGPQGSLETICSDDFAPALRRIGQRIALSLR